MSDALVADILATSSACGDSEAAQAYHNSLKDDPIAWGTLKPRGIQEYDETCALELRDCPRCRSTLARKFSLKTE